MRDGTKHFLIVGVGFAFIAGWILTIIVNTILVPLLEAILGAPPTKFYLGSVFLTAVSISLIGIAEVVGNRFFHKRFAPTGLGVSPLMISTLLFAILVMVYVWPALADVIRRFADHTLYYHHHGSEFFMMLSLPLTRLLLLPALYFAIACVTLRTSNSP